MCNKFMSRLIQIWFDATKFVCIQYFSTECHPFGGHWPHSGKNYFFIEKFDFAIFQLIEGLEQEGFGSVVQHGNRHVTQKFWVAMEWFLCQHNHAIVWIRCCSEHAYIFQEIRSQSVWARCSRGWKLIDCINYVFFCEKDISKNRDVWVFFNSMVWVLRRLGEYSWVLPRKDLVLSSNRASWSRLCIPSWWDVIENYHAYRCELHTKNWKMW